MEIVSLNFDPLNDNIVETDNPNAKYEAIAENTVVDIRITQRTKWKRFTVCEGLPDELNFEKVARALKKNFSCNAFIKDSPKHGKVIQMQGNHKDSLIRFLTETGICSEKNIRVHGS